MAVEFLKQRVQWLLREKCRLLVSEKRGRRHVEREEEEGLPRSVLCNSKRS